MSGTDFVFPDLLGLDQALDGADLVVTGGRLHSHGAADSELSRQLLARAGQDIAGCLLL
ncbi:hypothetical protein [Sinomonas sp. RB5]